MSKRVDTYIRDVDEKPDVIVIATGSEVQLALEAAQRSDKKVRVVSMPSTTEFDRQDVIYRESVLPRDVIARVAVEAAVMGGWYKYVGSDGVLVGMDSFGESAPADDLFAQRMIFLRFLILTSRQFC